MNTAAISDDVATGDFSEALTLIGTSLKRTTPEFTVNIDMIRCYCASIEDSNPIYWNDEHTNNIWGGGVSPPGMLPTWLMPMPWRPDGPQTRSAMLTTVPLPGKALINQLSDVEFLSPIRTGDRISAADKLLDISPLKDTRVGRGHFVTSESTIFNQHNEIRARWINIGLRYVPNP